MNDSRILKTLYLFLFSSIVLIFFTVLNTNTQKLPIFNEEVTLYNDGWYYRNPDSSSTPITLPAALDLPFNTTLRISNTLPDKYVEGMSVNIFTSLQALRVFINQKQIYEYGYEDSALLRPLSLNAFHLIRLPEDTKGKEITLEITSPYSTVSGGLEDITLGSKSANIAYILRNHVSSFLISILTLIMGVVFIVIYIYMNRRFKESKSLLYLGLFSVIVSIWSITETKMLQFFIPNPIIEYMMAYLAIMLCPLPYLLYIKGATHSSKLKKINWTCCFIIANFVVTNILFFTGIADYRDTLPSTYYFLIITLAMSIYHIVKEIFYFKNKEAYSLGISIIILCSCIAVDMFRFFILNKTDAAIFSRIGLLLFIFIVGISTVLKLSNVLEMGINAEAIHKLAYMDALTTINNRRAYVRDIDKLNKSLSLKSNIIAIMCDLNNLKQTNDTYGHESGDMLILNAANCIKESISPYGTCYRIGGDEFAVIIQNAKESTFQNILAKLKDTVAAYNRSNTLHIEIPIGYTHYSPDIDKSLYGTFTRADYLMYEEKARIKNGK